jgi:hypothetical protein
VILGQNPFKVDPATIKDVPVIATVLGGKEFPIPEAGRLPPGRLRARAASAGSRSGRYLAAGGAPHPLT